MKIVTSLNLFEKLKSSDNVILKCYGCNKNFEKQKKYVTYEIKTKKGQNKFCSKECFNRSKEKKIDCVCCQCSKKIQKTHSEIKKIKNNVFCSKSCSAIYNNKKRDESVILKIKNTNKNKSEEQKKEYLEKRKKTLIEKYGNLEDAYKIITYNMNFQKEEKIKNINKKKSFLKEKKSKIIEKYGTLENYNKIRKERLSESLKKYWREHPEKKIEYSEKSMGRKISDEARKKISLKAKKRVEDGTHSGWIKRNMPSYAERFFKKVLYNNSINYEFEKPCGKYFIDFAIQDKKIALEIDGKQHRLEERKLKDKEKDVFLKSEGWCVYRIEWNSINSLKGKENMKNKIKNFLNFYNKK